MSQSSPLGSHFKYILCFSVLKASVDLPRILWLHVLLLHTPLGLHRKENSTFLHPQIPCD